MMNSNNMTVTDQVNLAGTFSFASSTPSWKHSLSVLRWLIRSGRMSLLVVSILVLVIGSSAALAQSGAGSIQGTVFDSTGAVIPGALIHVVNVATNVSTDTKSNGVGFYQVPELFTGTYT